MKFRKVNKAAVILTAVFTIIFAIFYAIAVSQKDKNIFEACTIIIITVILPIMLIVMINYMRGNKYDKLYYKFKDGEKIKGYIVDTFSFWYHQSRNVSGKLYGIKVLANNKIYIVKWLENNESFWKIENKLKNIEFENGTISFDKIPVDVYLKDNDYYVYIKSINI